MEGSFWEEALMESVGRKGREESRSTLFTKCRAHFCLIEVLNPKKTGRRWNLNR